MLKMHEKMIDEMIYWKAEVGIILGQLVSSLGYL